MPERLGVHLSPSPGQDVLVAHSCVALLTLGPQIRSSMAPSPSGHCLTAGATSKLCREIRPSGHPGLWAVCACISECAPPLLSFLSASLPPPSSSGHILFLLSSVHPLSCLPPFQISSLSMMFFPIPSYPHPLFRLSEPVKGSKQRQRNGQAGQRPGNSQPWVPPPQLPPDGCHQPERRELLCHVCARTHTLHNAPCLYGGQAFMGERKEVSDPHASCISGQRFLKGSQQMRRVDMGNIHWPELVWAPPSCQNPQGVWLSAQAYRLSPQADSSRPGSCGSTLQPWGLSADPWMELKTLHSQLLRSGHSSVPMPTCSVFSPYLPGLGCSAKTPSKT